MLFIWIAGNLWISLTLCIFKISGSALQKIIFAQNTKNKLIKFNSLFCFLEGLSIVPLQGVIFVLLPLLLFNLEGLNVLTLESCMNGRILPRLKHRHVGIWRGSSEEKTTKTGMHGGETGAFGQGFKIRFNGLFKEGRGGELCWRYLKRVGGGKSESRWTFYFTIIELFVGINRFEPVFTMTRFVCAMMYVKEEGEGRKTVGKIRRGSKIEKLLIWEEVAG